VQGSKAMAASYSPPTKELMRVRGSIKEILDHPAKEILESFGLDVIGSEFGEYGFENKVSYIWKKGKPRQQKDLKLIRTDYGVLGSMIRELQKIDV
jgi:hypothetical protein